MRARITTRDWGDLAASDETFDVLSGKLTLNVSVHDGETARTQERTFDLIDVAEITLSEQPDAVVVDPGEQPVEAEWDLSAYSSVGERVGPEVIKTLVTSPATLPAGPEPYPGSPGARLWQAKQKKTKSKKAAT
jgi:hypothetical protein